jgi:hypothetical protein
VPDEHAFSIGSTWMSLALLLIALFTTIDEVDDRRRSALPLRHGLEDFSSTRRASAVSPIPEL